MGTMRIMLLIILILSALEKRRNAKRCRCLGDRPGLLVPVNLLDGDEDRLAYAAAFGSTVTNCLVLFGGDYIPDGAPMWTNVLFAMMAVTEMGIDYYPLFACLSKKTSCLWSFTGLLYSFIWFLVNLGQVFECVDKTEWVFYGQPVVLQLPVLMCLLYLVIIFFIRFLSSFLDFLSSLTGTQKTDEECLLDLEQKEKHHLMKQHQALHVAELLKGKRCHLPLYNLPCSENLGLLDLLRNSSDPTFRYSPRITATFTVALFCLYEFGLLLFVTVEKALVFLRLYMQGMQLYAGVAEAFGHGFYKQFGLFIQVARMSWYVAFGLSSAVTLNYILRIFLSYKLQMAHLLRGDHSLIPQRCVRISRSKILAYSLMYSGSQIAYVLWAYYVMIVSVFSCGMVLAYFVILPFLDLVPTTFLQPFWTLIPTVVMTYLVYYLKILISKRVLLQKDRFCNGTSHKVKRALALDNRRVYHNVSYFLFFYHILLGLYTCLVRVGKGIVLGVVYLGRIDRSGLVKDFEHWDTGYLSFVSFLRMEIAHTHPVLVVFCQLLLNACRDKRLMFRKENGKNGMVPFHCLASNRARNRWLKAYTLIKNPYIRHVDSYFLSRVHVE